MRRTVSNLGNAVICDLCGEDYTNSDAKGGITFGSKACCPACTPKLEADAKKYHEEHFIEKRCPPDKEFRAWVIEDLRGGQPGTSTLISFDNNEEFLKFLTERANPKPAPEDN